MNCRVIIFFGFYLLFAMASSISAGTIKGKVVKVTDGDTVTVMDSKGFKYRIRLAGIDAPEKEDQPYGKESTKSLSWLVYEKMVTVEYSKHDRYGKIVGKILAGLKGDAFCLPIECVWTLDVGLEQIKVGMAWHYKRYEKEQSKEDKNYYSKAERGAKKKQIGLWSDKNPIPPWKWRRAKRLKVLYQTCMEKAKGCKEKKYAKELGIDVDRLKIFFDEAMKNEDESIKKAFKASGLEEEEFAAEFKISPERLKSILNPE
jgi:endonuclease YncB( thermonuclease family)